MTKYILHGGQLSRETENDTLFFQEMTKDMNEGDKVLWVGFARRDNDDRLATFDRDKQQIFASCDKGIVVVNAQLEIFGQQVRDASVIFVTSGNPQELQKDIETCKDFLQLIERKVYAGSSAGALIVATKYFRNKTQKVCEGMGIFPISLMTHYGVSEGFNGTEENLQYLRDNSGDLEVIALKENEWIVKET